MKIKENATPSQGSISMRKWYIFDKKSIFLHLTLWSDHSFKSSFQDDSNDWSLHRVWWRNKDFSILDTHVIWGPASARVGLFTTGHPGIPRDTLIYHGTPIIATFNHYTVNKSIETSIIRVEWCFPWKKSIILSLKKQIYRFIYKFKMAVLPRDTSTYHGTTI